MNTNPTVAHRVAWLHLDPAGGTLHVKPDAPTSFAEVADQLAAAKHGPVEDWPAEQLRHVVETVRQHVRTCDCSRVYERHVDHGTVSRAEAVDRVLVDVGLQAPPETGALETAP